MTTQQEREGESSSKHSQPEASVHSSLKTARSLLTRLDNSPKLYGHISPPHRPILEEQGTCSGSWHDKNEDATPATQQAMDVPNRDDKEALAAAETLLILKGNIDKDGEGEEEKRWCQCRCIDDGSLMVLCGNPKCPVEWFHVSCVGEEAVELEDWRCEHCNISERGDTHDSK